MKDDLIKILVEGLNHSKNPSGMNYRDLDMEIPKDATHINDGEFIYRIHGTATGNFEKIIEENPEFLKTIFVNKIRDFSNLTRPRAIIALDRRIFVEQSISLSSDYLGLLEKEIIPEAGRFFSARSYNS